MGAEVRDYRPEDFQAVKAIHDASELDYEFPNLASPLFLVTKVFIADGIVRMFGGCYLQAELYLMADSTDWGTPQDKLDAIKALDKAAMEDLWLRGVDCCCLWLPPNMQRFGKRLTEDLGFSRDRDGWHTYSKSTK